MSAPTPIYLAEVQIAFRELLREHLQQSSRYQVLGEGDRGESVLTECLNLRPKLLILDMDLTGLDAIEVCRSLLQQDSDLRVVIVATHFDPASIRRMLNAGARGVVEKKASLGVLINAIGTVAEGSAYFSPVVHQHLRQLSVGPARKVESTGLTDREREVLQLVSRGKSSRLIAQELGVSLKTAENHRHNLMRKLNAHNGADVTREAYRQGLL